jgi:hypothetical protein
VRILLSSWVIPSPADRFIPEKPSLISGCDAGADVCVAALLVGSRDRVIGVDMTAAMVQKARANVGCLLPNLALLSGARTPIEFLYTLDTGSRVPPLTRPLFWLLGKA